MSISSDEINFLIYRYLQENGFTHTAFSFAYESLVNKSSVAETDLPPGALITFLQKGLEYIGIEENIEEDGNIREFDTNYSLLSPFVCDAVANREDRRVKRRLQNNESEAVAASSSSSSAATSSSSSSSNSNSNNNISTNIKSETHSNAGANSGVIVNKDSVEESSSLAVSMKDDDLRHLNLVGHQGEVFMCVWNPLQSKLASGSADGMCRVWDLADVTSTRWLESETTGNIKIKTAIMPHADPGEKYKDITSISWSPNGQSLATGCYTGEARIWDVKGNLKMVLKEHSGPVFSLKWNKQGTYLLSGSYDRRTIIWSPITGKIVKVFSLHSQPVLDVDWRDSVVFASCSSDMSIQICSVSGSDSNPLCVLIGHTDEVNAVCWSPGGKYLASCSDDSAAKIWSFDANHTKGVLVHDLRGHSKEIFTLRWTLTGPLSNHPESPLLLCTASFDGTVKVWDGETGGVIYSLGQHTQPVYSVSPSPYGFLLATGSLGGHISVWSLRDGSLLHEMKGPGDTFDVSWSHDGSFLSACFSSGSLMVQDASYYQCAARDTAGEMKPRAMMPPPLALANGGASKSHHGGSSNNSVSITSDSSSSSGSGGGNNKHHTSLENGDATATAAAAVVNSVVSTSSGGSDKDKNKSKDSSQLQLLQSSAAASVSAEHMMDIDESATANGHVNSAAVDSSSAAMAASSLSLLSAKKTDQGVTMQ